MAVIDSRAVFVNTGASMLQCQHAEKDRLVEHCCCCTVAVALSLLHKFILFCMPMLQDAYTINHDTSP